MLIERVTDERYAPALESRILRPLGLTATRYCDVAPLIPHRASGYQQRDTGVVNADYTSMTAPFAAGGLCSTVGDLAAWNRAPATGRVVGAASLRRMTTPDSAAAGARYGYGIVVMDIGGHRVVRHNGGIQGFRADNAYLPDDGLSVTVLTNLTAPGPEELVLDIIRAALTESLHKAARIDRAAMGGTAMPLPRPQPSRTAFRSPRARSRRGPLCPVLPAVSGATR